MSSSLFLWLNTNTLSLSPLLPLPYSYGRSSNTSINHDSSYYCSSSHPNQSSASTRRISRRTTSPPLIITRAESIINETSTSSSTAAEAPTLSRIPVHSVNRSSAAFVVKLFYDLINRHELSLVEELIAEDCVYEDLIFPNPFVGRKAILDFFKKFTDSISTDLQFVIDDISEDDSSAVGVKWHLEWNGRPFPFSKGCSFYRTKVINGNRQIIYARDCVEPALKPGEMTLVIIKGLTAVLQRFPQLADRL